MWELSVEGSEEEIYRKLKTAFDNEIVEKEPYEFVIKHRNRGTETYTKDRAVIDDGISLQFRRMLKFIQVLTEDMEGTFKVSFKGEVGKSIDVKVEVA